MARLKKRRRWLPRDQWEVLIPGHHEGFISWDTYQANQARLAGNIRPVAHQPGTGAVREGCALCQGLATCGTCGRKLAVYYDGPAKIHPRLLLHQRRHHQRPRRPPPARRRHRDRRRRRRRVPGRAASRPRCKPAWPPPRSSKPATTPSWPSTAARSSRPATRPPAPNAATGRSTRKTGWSPAAWKPSGTPRCRHWPTPRTELARRQQHRPADPDRRRARHDPGPRRRPAPGMGRAHHHRQGPQAAAAHPAGRSRASPCTATTPEAAPTCCCAGKAGRSPS